MPVFHDSALIGAAGASGAGAGGYQISRSLRFNSADSAYLSRTPGSAGNRKTWTWAGWVKRGKLGSTNYHLFSAKDGSNDLRLYFFNNDTIEFTTWNGSSAAGGLRKTTQVFRDPSAWYHIVLAYDTTQATAADRIKLYVNGSQVTAFSSTSDPSQDLDWIVNNTIAHQIGAYNTTEFHDGYLADIHFIDGQALTPSSFAETDAITGQWVPKAFSGGSYGTNGFRLTFSDNSGTTATTLGKDAAGSNNWTPTNFSVASGAGNDSLVDTPTPYGTDTGAGGEVRGNYATWNPLDIASGPTLSNGNLDFSYTSSLPRGCRATFAIPSSGKWYFETIMGGSSQNSIGVVDAKMNIAANPSTYCVLYDQSGSKNVNGSASGYGASFTSGDVIGVAVNSDTGQVTFYKNNTSQGAISLTAGVEYFPFMGGYNSTTSTNFGQRPFAYTAPSGFKALCDTNLPAPVVAKPSTVMDVVLYTGNSTDNRAITGLGFSPDLVWFGPRSQSGQDKVICDSVRGVQKALFSNQTYVEADPALYGSVGSFDSNGFTIKKGIDATFGFNQVNLNSSTYVAWTWDAGTTTSSNGSGSITSQVRANASSGFSVVSWSGVAGANGTIGHGLGVAPQFVILKNRGTADNWRVYHVSVGATGFLQLASTGATVTSDEFQNTSPTSSVFYLRGNTWNAASNNYIAYFFAPVAGYSSFGSYTGNGSTDGPFVYTGFRPRWVMLKQSSGSGTGWQIHDTSRNTYNVMNNRLQPNNSDAESTYTTSDFLSNGFKLRDSDPSWNSNGATYIYAAFAENPFQYARAR